jgi:hypothetical protein
LSKGEIEERELKIHSHITDMLSDDHQLAFESVYCTQCGDMVHACNNECMQTWIEWKNKGACLICFAAFAQLHANALERADLDEFFKINDTSCK